MRRVIGALALWCAVMVFTGGKPSARMSVYRGIWQLEVIQPDSMIGTLDSVSVPTHFFFPETTIAFDTTITPIDSVTSDTTITADTTYAQVDSLIGVMHGQEPDTLCVEFSGVEYHTPDQTYTGYGGSIFNMATDFADSVSVDVLPCATQTGIRCTACASDSAYALKRNVGGQILTNWENDFNTGDLGLSQYRMLIVYNAKHHAKRPYHIIIQTEAR